MTNEELKRIVDEESVLDVDVAYLNTWMAQMSSLEGMEEEHIRLIIRLTAAVHMDMDSPGTIEHRSALLTHCFRTLFQAGYHAAKHELRTNGLNERRLPMG